MKFRINILFLAVFLAMSLIVSCKLSGTAKHAKYPARLSNEIQAQYNNADELYRQGNFRAADTAFAQFISENEYNELTDLALFKRGEIRFRQNNYSAALNFYNQSTSRNYNTKISPDAYLKSALCLYHMGKHEDVTNEVSKIRREDTSPEIRIRADSLGMLAARKAGWPGKRIVRFALFLLDDYIDLGKPLTGNRDLVVEKNDAHNFVKFWIDDPAVTEEDINTLPRKSYEKKPSGGYVLYKEILIKQRYGDLETAEKLLKKFVHAYPKSEYYEDANLRLTELKARTGDFEFKVGVILPLSGKYRVYGESVRKGIECALGIYKPCEGPSGIQMRVKDSMGNPSKAAEAVKELASEDVQVIIGPLLSVNVIPAANEAQTLGIPLITISQKPGTSKIGDYIFRNSVTSKSEVDTLVDYAMGKKKLKRYMIIYPKNKKGEEFNYLFTEAVISHGGKIASSQSYLPGGQDLTAQIRGLPFQSSEVDLTESAKTDYDAIFIPGSAWDVTYIAPMLSMMGIKDVQLLGTMRWNDSSLIRRSGKYLEGAAFVQSFDRNSTDPTVRAFVDRFRAAYKVDPTLLEALGYDSMKMIIEASARGANQSNTIRDQLAKIRKYPGTTGKISFDDSGDAMRHLNLMIIKNGEAVRME